MANRTPDVLVIGAGTAGAAAAARMAENGLKVVLADRRSPDEAGADWINAVPPWLFDEAAVARPAPPELTRDAGTHASLLADGGGTIYQVVPEDPGMHVNMRLLTDRLQQRARDAGVELVRGRVEAVELDGDRVRRVILEHDGAKELFEPRLTVDASGMAGAIRRRVPGLAATCPEPAQTDVCHAAQYQYTVGDPMGARVFLAEHGSRPGANLTLTGVVGGYSILMVNVEEGLEEVGVLSGTIPADGAPTGEEVVDRFVRSSPWIGEKLLGGKAPIPLGQPYTRLCAPGVALVGNAANHVYALHGSGVGMGLIAARMLADEASGAGDPGDIRALHRYAVRFLRRYGGRLAGADLFRRFSQTLGRDDISDLMASDMIGGPMLSSGLNQIPFKPDGETVRIILGGALHHPRFAARVAPTASRMMLLQQVFQYYPETPDPAALNRFDRRLRMARGF